MTVIQNNFLISVRDQMLFAHSTNATNTEYM